MAKAMTNTSVYVYTKFNNTDKSKNQKLNISLFEKTMNFKLYSYSGDKFKDKPDVDIYFASLAYDGAGTLLAAVNELLKRLIKAHNGDKVNSDPFIFTNNSNYKEATSSISFDVYTKDAEDGKSRTIVVVDLKKKENKGDKEWKDTGKLYISTGAATNTYSPSSSVYLTEAYKFFYNLSLKLESMVNGTSIKFNEHWKKVLSPEDEKASNGSSSNSSSARDYDDDDDVF